MYHAHVLHMLYICRIYTCIIHVVFYTCYTCVGYIPVDIEHRCVQVYLVMQKQIQKGAIFQYMDIKYENDCLYVRKYLLLLLKYWMFL